MKIKLFSLSLLTVLIASFIFSLILVKAEDEVEIEPKMEVIEKHLILNKDGSYGGTLNKELYGEGAPLNGELDHVDSGYYKINDYYNANTTEYRTIAYHFSPYQQTMANSDGVASALMVMSYFGFADHRIYSEERLVKKYEKLNGETVYKNGVTAEGLKNLFTSFGLISKTNTFTANLSIKQISTWVKKSLYNDYFPMIAFNDDTGYRWHVVIGLDTGKETTDNDDVLILADPFDASDHYQDGYQTLAVKNLVSWWLDLNKLTLNDAGDNVVAHTGENVCVKAPKGYKVILNHGEENLLATNTAYEKHLILNADGTSGGQMDGGIWGGGTSINGMETDNIETVYYKFNDYYNFESTDTRTILNHFRPYIQTTASTCGISSTMVTMLYYGATYDPLNRDLNDLSCINEYKLMKLIEKLYNNEWQVYNRGVANYEIAKLVKHFGYEVVRSTGYNHAKYLNGEVSSFPYPTPESMFTTMKNDLSEGHPFLVGWKVSAGHWETIIGYDDMGTESLYDDVVIFADSSDSSDHYQDGYNTYSALFAYHHWCNGAYRWNQQGIVFKKA